MSYGSRSMLQSDNTKHELNVPLSNPHLHAHLPHILRQSNYLGAGDMHTANVAFRVKPHNSDTDAAQVHIQAQRGLHELYPTQSTLRKDACEAVDDWSKHAIVASVAGLHSKLAQLDSEIRTGASADASAPSVVRQLQDHATLLRENAKIAAQTQSNHKQTAALTHRICSQMHDNAQQHATTLGACKDDIAKLKSKQSTSVGLMHDICSELHKGLLEHDDDKQGLQREISLLQKKDVVAQALLAKMLTMLDEHDSVLQHQKHKPEEHMALLDGMCEALERTKSKMSGYEKTQREMQRVVDDFKAGQLSPPRAYETEAVQTKLDRYMRLSNDLDVHCREALEQHGAKMEELQRTQQQALHEQRTKLQQLERAQQQAFDEHHSKMQTLERQVLASQSQHRKIADLEGKVQELALLHLNSSQKDSIQRVTERDVKLLQHEMNQMRALKQDVDDARADVRKMQYDTNAANERSLKLRDDFEHVKNDNRARNEHSMTLHKDVEQVKATVSGLAQAQQTHSTETNSKLLDVRRDVTLQNIRIEKTLHDLSCKLAA